MNGDDAVGGAEEATAPTPAVGAARFLGDADLHPSDPYAREAETFPRLTADQVRRAAALGRTEALPRGTTLFERDDRGVDFFIVLAGRIEIYGHSGDGEEVVTVHGEHQFTGELDLFNNRAVIVGGRMGEDGQVVRLRRAQFRRLLAAEPDIADVVMRALILRRAGFVSHQQAAVTIVGSPRSADCLRLQRFLTRNGHPFVTLDPAADPTAELPQEVRDRLDELERGVDAPDGNGPLVHCGGGSVLNGPSIRELAEHLGISEPTDRTHVADVVVVGAGPSGLAAAVYAASEGLDTLVVEGEAPGGQAGTSSRIENYLGFPTGVSGQDLAERAQVQAQKFGARIVLPHRAVGLRPGPTWHTVDLEGGGHVCASSVVVATGARYRRLDQLDDAERFDGNGVHYAATAVEAGLCQHEEVVVVGAGNSAGQAAVYLSRHAAHVYMLVRGETLGASMSDYLVNRVVAASDRITVRCSTEVTALVGEGHLERVTWTDRSTGESETRRIANLFLMLGALPNSGWLPDSVALDHHGFVRTGLARGASEEAPHLMATSLPRVFAVGDVREGSVKRVASAVGEGSVVVASVHQALDASR